MQTEDNDITRGFLAPVHFAEALDVPVGTVLRWVREDRLPAVRLGRLVLIPQDALRLILERGVARDR